MLWGQTVHPEDLQQPPSAEGGFLVGNVFFRSSFQHIKGWQRGVRASLCCSGGAQNVDEQAGLMWSFLCRPAQLWGKFLYQEWAGGSRGRSAWCLPVAGLHGFGVAATSDSSGK